MPSFSFGWRERKRQERLKKKFKVYYGTPRDDPREPARRE